MDKLNIIEQFEQFMKDKFPNRIKPVQKELPSINKEKFDDEKFTDWRKSK